MPDPKTRAAATSKQSTIAAAKNGVSSKEQEATIAKKKVSRPTFEDVARRAYEIYESRGGGHGRDTEDWDAAEAELGKPAEPAVKTRARDRKSANGDPSGVASMDA